MLHYMCSCFFLLICCRGIITKINVRDWTLNWTIYWVLMTDDWLMSMHWYWIISEYKNKWTKGWTKETDRQQSIKGQGLPNRLIGIAIILAQLGILSVSRYLKERLTQVKEERSLEKESIQKYEVTNYVVLLFLHCLLFWKLLMRWWWLWLWW